MIIIKFAGGIGNQLFQYALYYKLQISGIEVRADFNSNSHGSFSLDNLLKLNLIQASNNELKLFKIPNSANILNRLMIKIRMIIGIRMLLFLSHNKPIYFHQGRFNRYKLKLRTDDHVYLDGTWANYEVANRAFSKLRNILEMRINNTKIDEFLKSIPRNSVALHYRAGDYKKLKGQGFFVLDEIYYYKAISRMNNILKEPTYYIFTNDELNQPFSIKNLNQSVQVLTFGFSDIEELYIMSKFSNFIIANSTFSLWASYLADAENKIVIAPRKWMSQHYAYSRPLLEPDTIII